MNKEQYEELKNKPEFNVVRCALIQSMNGNSLRLKHINYFAEETRQLFQKLDSMGYKIMKKQVALTDRQMNDLYSLCLTFINQQKIDCSETIYQSDRVIENAYEFIEQICEIVGYCEESK